MKKILCTLFIAIVFMSCSNTRTMNEFYNKYEDKATIIPLPNFATRWASKATGGTKLFEYLKSSKVFVIKDIGKYKQKRIMRDLASSAQGDKLSQVMKWSNKDSGLNVYYTKRNNSVERLVMGINGIQTVLVIDAKLDIEHSVLESLLEKTNSEDIQFFKQILK